MTNIGPSSIDVDKPVQAFNGSTLAQIASFKGTLDLAANAAGVSSLSIAAPLTREINKFEVGDYEGWLLSSNLFTAAKNSVALFGSTVATGTRLTEQDYTANLQYVRDNGITNAQSLGLERYIVRADNPVLNDLGVARIQVGTAMDAVSYYNNNQSAFTGGDALNLLKYVNNTPQLVADLINPATTMQVSIALQAVIANQANEWASARVGGWQQYSDADKAAFTAAYSTLGETKLNTFYTGFLRDGGTAGQYHPNLDEMSGAEYLTWQEKVSDPTNILRLQNALGSAPNNGAGALDPSAYPTDSQTIGVTNVPGVTNATESFDLATAQTVLKIFFSDQTTAVVKLGADDTTIDQYGFEGVLRTQQEVLAAGNSILKYYDPKNTHSYNELDVAKGADGKVTAAQVALDPNILAAGGSVGQIFGSALGASLGGSGQLGKLVGSVAGGTVGSLIAQKFIQVLATSMTADLSKVSIADVFASQHLDIAGAGIGAVSSFLTAELGSALHIGGFGGTLFNIAGSSLTFSVLSQVANSNLSFDAAIATIDWSQAVSGAYNAASLNIDGLLGGYLAHEFVPAKTHEGAVGGELLGAIGNLILPGGLGSFVGTVLGTLIGNQFGTIPSPGAVDLLDQTGYYYGFREYQTSDHGSYTAPDAMAPAADAIINAYLHAVNGVALDHSKQAIIGYIQNPDLLFLSGTPGHPDHSFTNASDAVHAAALDVLQNTEVIGGDLLLKRAHHNSASNDPAKNPAGSAGLPGQAQNSAAEQLVTLSGDLSVAQDYETYLDNREAINALIAANPDSAFAAGWIATFARVNDLKLNQVGASDFLGGLVGYLDSVSKAGLGPVAANATVSHGGVNDSVITVAIKAPNGADVPGSLVAFADATTIASDATGQTVQLQFAGNLIAGGFSRLGATASGGNGVNDLWFGGDGGNNFAGTAGHDILVGGAAGDTIRGGAGWDFIDGGAGNDTLFGDDGNDILRGGTGPDNLQGGAGNDTYVFNRGDGADTIYDDYRPLTLVSGASGTLGGSISSTYQPVPADGGSDTLEFGAGITVADISIASSGDDRTVTVRNPANPNAQDTILMYDWAKPYNRIEFFSFADGSTFSIAGILAHPGTAGADNLSWTDAAAWLDGGSGNDILTTGAFNDTLRGGPGNDWLIGGAGFDTAIYDGPASAYTVVSYNGSVAVLSHGVDGQDRLQGIETIAFADRTVATAAVAAFDPWEYIASHTDLIQAFGANPQAGFDHYITSGFNAGYATNSFDAVEYLASNPDLIAAHFTAASAEQHYVGHGYNEHRATTSFDAAEYLASNPDLIQAGFTPASALQHYASNGYFEHRPTSSFDATEYLASNPDLIAAGFTPASALQHYVSTGYFEHRPTTSFDVVEYLASNPDLIQAAFTPAAALQHYISNGYFEHRPTNSFDATEYLASNPDLIQAGFTPASASQHYAAHGYFEHRPINSFDATEYLASNPDLIAAGWTPAAALQHYVANGYFEHRPTNSFDATEYLASNPDLIQGGFTPATAATAYVSEGYFQHRPTTSFDATEYLASNPDLIAAGFTPGSALQQYVSNGYFEHRPTHSFDATEYLASNPDLIQGGFTPASALQHYVAHGYFEHRPINSFDATEYLASNPDLIQAGLTPAMALQHYVGTGYFEHRPTDSFDAMEYLASNPGLVTVYGFDTTDAKQHYVAYGFGGHLATHSFDALEYIASNPDLIHDLGLDTAAAEAQYVTTGVYQDRALTSFDAAQYLANYPDLGAAFGSGNLAAARQHYIAYGFDEGLTDRKPDQVVVHNQDGSTTTTIYEVFDTQDWNSFRTDTDAQGHVTWQLGIKDNGATWQNVFDVAGAFGWDHITSTFDTAGHLLTQTTALDDGSHVLVANDPANAYAWSTFTMAFDADWKVTSIGNVTNHDGSHTADVGQITASLDTLAWYATAHTPNDWHIA
jgi:hypothetical protein